MHFVSKNDFLFCCHYTSCKVVKFKFAISQIIRANFQNEYIDQSLPKFQISFIVPLFHTLLMQAIVFSVFMKKATIHIFKVKIVVLNFFPNSESTRHLIFLVIVFVVILIKIKINRLKSTINPTKKQYTCAFIFTACRVNFIYLDDVIPAVKKMRVRHFYIYWCYSLSIKYYGSVKE